MFLTAYFALHEVGRMRRGERSLIHAAAGGVGQAAVQLAQRAGVEIFATAGRAREAGIFESHWESGTLCIPARLLLQTRSCARRLAKASIWFLTLSLARRFPKVSSCWREGGRFLEIGKAEIWDEKRVAAINSKAAYHAVDLAQLIQSDPAALRRMFVSARGGNRRRRA